jgi:HPr kinase/phosphorylase
LEVRGLGLVHLPHESQAEIRLIVDLLSAMVIPRLPEPAQLEAEVLGVALPRLMLDGKSPAAPAILRASLRHFGLVAGP